MTVRIGVDFGTAFTKVAVRSGVDKILVDWAAVTGDGSSVGRYVMPGLVCRTRKGEYGWLNAEGSEIHGNLKLPMIEDPGTDECPMATLAHLAAVIRYARAYLYGHADLGRKVASRTLRWELNIGCPTKPHENTEVVARFRRLAQSGWKLAGMAHWGEKEIARAWKETGFRGGLETDPGVIPEFVAQIAGYIQSPQVRDDLHALVDIGAATIDVATFNVVLASRSDPLPKIPIFFSAVRAFGTHYLSYNRYRNLGLEPVWDDDAPVESTDSLAKRVGKDRHEIDVIDAEFADSVARCIKSVVDGTRTNRHGYPRSEAWREGLPVFVTGGGAACELYRRAIRKAEEEMRRTIGLDSRFRFISLESFGIASELLEKEAALRTTTAIGLTEDAESIARVVPHRDIGPVTYRRATRVDRTDIYSD